MLVAARAKRVCEYCLIHEDDTFFGCEVDHVISVKHGGTTDAGNLAYACVFCNRLKGSDIGSVSERTGRFARLFNPRTDRWVAHFRLVGAIIRPTTVIGEVTARVLDLNNSARVLERHTLIALGRYPSAAALSHMVR